MAFSTSCGMACRADSEVRAILTFPVTLANNAFTANATNCSNSRLSRVAQRMEDHH